MDIKTTKEKQKAKVTPVGKILPEPKKPENLVSQFGPVGAPRPLLMAQQQQQQGQSAHGRHSAASPWSNSPAEATPVQPPYIFGQQQQQQSDIHPEKAGTPTPPPSLHHGSPLNRAQPQQQQQQQQSSPFHQATASSNPGTPDFLGGGGGSNHGSPIRAGAAGASASSPGASLMQSLQMERRQRTEQYLRERQTDWPGFDQQPLMGAGFLEGLWDSGPGAGGGTVSVPNSAGVQALQQQQQQQQQQQWMGNNVGEVWPSVNWGVSMNLSGMGGDGTLRVTHPGTGGAAAVPQDHQVLQQQQRQQQLLRHHAGVARQNSTPAAGGDNAAAAAAAVSTGLGFNPLQLSSIWGSPRKTAAAATQPQQQQQQQQGAGAEGKMQEKGSFLE